MNIMAQNTIDELGRIIPKDRLTHDQSWKWSYGTLVNSRVGQELLQECRYGFFIRQIVNWAVAVRQQYPGQRILASKIDYKERLLSRNTPLRGGPKNSNAAAGRRDCHHHASPNIRVHTLSL